MTSKKLTTEEFIEKARKIHKNKYDYSKTNYTYSRDYVDIICPKHGEFSQRANCHLSGQGCPMCRAEKNRTHKLDTLDSFIKKAQKIHGGEYDYSHAEYVNSYTPLAIICKKHGAFQQIPNSHLQGHGCPKCGADKVLSSLLISSEEFIGKARKVHGDKYDYSRIKYKNAVTPIEILCKKHGVFWQKPTYHLCGNGCPKCGIDIVKAKLSSNTKEFIKKATNIFGNKYIYTDVNYINETTKVKIICPKHGEFWATPCNHIINKSGCPRCCNPHSKWEKEVYKFVKYELDNEVILGDRTILDGYEIDIYSSNYKIGIECDGIRWHTNEFQKENDYHLKKTENCAAKGIALIHIYDDEWINKKDIVKSRLRCLFGKATVKIYAKKCIIKKISILEKNTFLQNNHIKSMCKSSINYGLYYNDELISVIAFKMYKSGICELVRFCSKLNTVIVGGASKILRYFIKNYRPKEIIARCDLRWSDGLVFKKIGFTLNKIEPPSYSYVVNGHKIDDNSHIEDGSVKHRIYDCGCKVYKMTFIEP